MQTRMERNKSLHEKIDREIQKVANKNSNKEFKDTNETLKTIDPEFFGGEKQKNENKEKLNTNQKKILRTGLVFIILTIIILLAVVIYNANK